MEEVKDFPFQGGKGSARAHKRRAAKPRERREKRGWLLSRFALSVASVVIFVSRAFCSAY